MLKQLNQGKWTRPTDKSAVYTEIEPGQEWGIRVTLIDNFAKVEAIQGEKGVWYKGPDKYSTIIKQPSFLERAKGISFEEKLLAEVEKKRLVAAAENKSQ